MKLDGMTIPQLRDLKTRIDATIPRAINKARSEILARIEIEATAAGVSVKDIIGASIKPNRSRHPKGVQFTNPNNPAQTWSGRGRPPLWITKEMRK